MTELSDEQKRDFEAAAFRRLVGHLRERTDVQNIDLMNLAGFCRNCLSKWYRAAAEERGVAVPVRQAVAAEAGEVHQVDVLDVAAFAQVLDQPAEGGGFELAFLLLAEFSHCRELLGP